MAAAAPISKVISMLRETEIELGRRCADAVADETCRGRSTRQVSSYTRPAFFRTSSPANQHACGTSA